MRIVVADRRGIVATEVRRGFSSDKWGAVEVVKALCWSELRSAIVNHPRVLVISAQPIEGFDSITNLAKQVKNINPCATFCVYNGPVEKYGSEVDFVIPHTQKGDQVGLSIAQFLRPLLRGESVGQLPLFF